jgi:hypothetical protein
MDKFDFRISNVFFTSVNSAENCSEGKSLSSLDIIVAIQCEVFEDNFRVVDLIILL